MMKHQPIIPIILSGGAGTRLWPLSNEETPKQFLRFGSDYSLMQQTVLRCADDMFDARPIVVSGESQRFLIAEDLRGIDRAADIILEPMRRDSCAAIVAGCLQAIERNPAAMVLILAADHQIPDSSPFVKAVAIAQTEAEAGYLVAFGIKPKHAATGYGYIKPGASLATEACRRIETFVEKPDALTAEKYLREGYLWNSGNFLFSAQVFIDELSHLAPDILHAVKASYKAARRDIDFVWLEKAAFARSPQISVDFAVMEKTDRSAVCAVDYDWSDIGSWDAVHSLLTQDEMENAIEGQVLVLNGRNNLVHSSNHMTALYGVDDLVVVVTSDGLLVTKRGLTEKVKDIVAALSAVKFDKAE
jgi:mannose-1-phosphate guanylyltransferase / mannose-6-phosphate isomerase